MSKADDKHVSERLTGQDLSFWWVDNPMQRTTMAMLMILDRSPDEQRLRQALERAIEAVPRLSQRVINAPLDITLPRWETDPTFDLDYHVRRHALTGRADLNELFRAIGPTYETPFDRSRPLWDVRVFDGLGPDGGAAMFFKLHHAVADGVGGNAIFAAMTDWERESPPSAPRLPVRKRKGSWPGQAPLVTRVWDAVWDRVDLDLGRARSVAATLWDALQDPEQIERAAQSVRSIIEAGRFDSGSPLKAKVGRARRLSGLSLPFQEVRALKQHFGGTMIDVILTIMARAIGKWHVKHHLTDVRELMTLVPVNLRKQTEWTDQVQTGNRATGILVPLPIHIKNPLTLYKEVRKRMEQKKEDPASQSAPMLAEIFSILPRQIMTWLAQGSFGDIDYIVTNVPGILVPRYLAGAEILATYPFAPVAKTSPVSIALYGYRDRLFIGIDSDETTMPDVERFQEMIRESFEELRAAVDKRQNHRRPLKRTA